MIDASERTSAPPDIAIKPKSHRNAAHLAERACHVANSALQFGLT